MTVEALRALLSGAKDAISSSRSRWSCDAGQPRGAVEDTVEGADPHMVSVAAIGRDHQSARLSVMKRVNEDIIRRARCRRRPEHVTKWTCARSAVR